MLLLLPMHIPAIASIVIRTKLKLHLVKVLCRAPNDICHLIGHWLLPKGLKVDVFKEGV